MRKTNTFKVPTTVKTSNIVNYEVAISSCGLERILTYQLDPDQRRCATQHLKAAETKLLRLVCLVIAYTNTSDAQGERR